jgi:hypothetical protein
MENTYQINQQSHLKNYLNTECILYKINFQNLSVFLMATEYNKINGKSVISFFENQVGQTLKLTKEDEETFLLEDFSFPDIDTNTLNKSVLNEFQKEILAEKYVYLVYIQGNCYIKINIDYETICDNGNVFLGAFLHDKEEFQTFLSENCENPEEMISFEMELSGSGMSRVFLEEDDEKIKIDEEQEGNLILKNRLRQRIRIRRN